MRIASILGPMLIVLMLVASCGKKGSPDAPGPASEVIYPRSYPSR